MKNNLEKKINLGLPPVGIKILTGSIEGYDSVSVFHGVSYCQAICNATYGQEMLILSDSIKICQWSPVVTGLKQAENEFEKSIPLHLPSMTTGVYIAPLYKFRKDLTPDIITIRTYPDNFRSMLKILGREFFIDPKPYGQDLTALQFLYTELPQGASGWLIRNTNKWLAFLNRFYWWQEFNTFLFRSKFVTRVFDKLITKYMANMSMCRNSMAVPFQKKKANISYFCTGGIAWGKNLATNMTSGFPFDIFQKLEPYLDYPGKKKNDHRLQELLKEREYILAKTKNALGSVRIQDMT